MFENNNLIKERVSDIRERMAKAAIRVGRNPSEVSLMLVTKTIEPAVIEQALRGGERLLGENKIQELKSKAPYLTSLKESDGSPLLYQMHFIGHLQTNKIKEAITYATTIQSVDRLSLVQKLQNRLELEDKAIDVYLQVNTSAEESKYGVEPAKALEFALQVREYDRLHIKGLMTIGLFSAEQERVRSCFKKLKELQLKMLDKGVPVEQLSMGMSNDFETAIEEGSTLVRVGTSIFGPRPYPDSYYWPQMGSNK